MVSLVTVMHDGKSVEMATFGCEGLFGLVSAFVTRQSFGRYIVQLSGTASRIELSMMHEAMAARPEIQTSSCALREALMARPSKPWPAMPFTAWKPVAAAGFS